MFVFISPFLQKSDGHALPVATRVRDNTQWVFLMFVGVACVGGLLVGALTIACLRTHARQLASGKLGLGPEAGNVTHYEYQVWNCLACALHHISAIQTFSAFKLF